MRHDPAVASLIIMLRQLKMFGMAQAVSELAEQGVPAFVRISANVTDDFGNVTGLSGRC